MISGHGDGHEPRLAHGHTHEHRCKMSDMAPLRKVKDPAIVITIVNKFNC